MSRTMLLCSGVAVATLGLTLALTPDTADARARRKARAPLVLTSFVQEGRTDVRRNETLKFKFSALLKKKSVSRRTVRISAVTSNGLVPATGAFKVRGSRIKFDPTRSQRNFDESRKRNAIVSEPDNPEGFGSFQDYVVDIQAFPDTPVLKNRINRPMRQSYTDTFRTNGDYDDLFEGQPRFVGDFGSGLLGFSPPRSGVTGLVDEDAVIVLEFSEPMDISTLDPASTVTVRRISLDQSVPGTIRKDPNEPNGRRFLFEPSFGFGSDALNERGWDIEVTIGNFETGQFPTDLAGNPLKRPITFPVFTTRYVEGAATASVISEDFSDQANMDLATLVLGGEWNTLEEGALLGGVPTTFPDQDVRYDAVNTGVPTFVRTRLAVPLVAETAIAACAASPNGNRQQTLYFPADIGGEGAIVAMGWGPSSNALFAATYSQVELRLQHTSINSLGTNFEGNYNLGGPQTVFSGEYDVPQAKNINPTDPVDANGVTQEPNETGYWLWPQFSTPFEWNGSDNLLFEQIAEPGSTCQIMRVGFFPGGTASAQRHAFVGNTTSPTAAFVQPVVFDARIKKRRRTTQAISTWYQLVSDDGQFSQPIVSPVAQPGGVSVIVEMEGAHGKVDPLNPGGLIADPVTATGWTTDVTQVGGHRFVRFRVRMVANLGTNQSARITSIQIPFRF